VNALGLKGIWDALKRFWWVVVGVTLCATVLSLVQYAGVGNPRRHVYVASQELRVVALPSGGITAYEGDVVRLREAALARDIATGPVLSSPTLDAAVLAELSALTPEMRARFVGNEELHPTAGEVAGALSAFNDGAALQLVARWPSPGGAWALATAAARALAGDAAVGPLTTQMGTGQGLTVRIEPVGATPPVLDAAVEMAARLTLALRMVLGVAVGILAALAMHWLRPRHEQSPAWQAEGASVRDVLGPGVVKQD
jgi:hypothetical protein